jgi:uncharacterized protein YkwD
MKSISSIIKNKINLFLILALPLPLLAQPDPWQAWDAAVIRTLNTAAEAEYLNEEEKKVILFINMARHDGPLFSESFLDAYIRQNRLENSSYIRSLRRDLKKVRGQSSLLPETDLTAIAQGHARTMGEKGSTGHDGFKKRFEPLMGNPYMHVAENCSYGYERAIDIVLTLLIDEGIKNLGHRNNILAPDFNSVGVAIRPHKTYRVNCVMDFGYRDRSSMNDIPY